MSPRAQKLLIVGVLAAVIVVAIVVLGSAGSDSDSGPADDAGEVEKLFAGIPQRGVVLGNPDAPERVIEFVDMQCPFCAEFSKDALPEIVSGPVRKGELALELRVIAFIGVQSDTAAGAAAAAALQNRLFQFADLFFLNQGVENSGYVDDQFLNSLYEATPGLDVAQADEERTSAEAQPLIVEADELAAELDVQSTPSFFLVRGKGRPIPMEIAGFSFSDFQSALDAARSG